jgi:hypothetical protein
VTIFKEIGKKGRIWTQNDATIYAKNYIVLCSENHHPFFRQRVAEIFKTSDHNIDPGSITVDLTLHYMCT